MMDALNKGLAFLCGKYSVPMGRIEGETATLPDGMTVRLLPHRVERRFVELKNMIGQRTLEGVSTLRFARFAAGGDLRELLWRELDLAAFLTGSRIAALYAVCAGTAAANVIAHLDGEVSLSLECGVGLPAGREPVDRHEIIAARGVGCDQAVDRQIPAASIYLYNDAPTSYTDVDEELFGLGHDEIHRVRAAFAVLGDPALGTVWNAAYDDARRCADAVFEADRETRVVQFAREA